MLSYENSVPPYLRNSVPSTMILSTDAIVLHSRRYGDSSRIVTLYTRDMGKLTVVAKGARTMKSALGAALEPLSHVRCTIYHGRSRDIHTISKAETVRTRKRVGGSLDLLTAGLLMCDMLVRTQANEQADENVFELMIRAVEKLEQTDEPLAYSVALRMRLELAENMGFGLPASPPPMGSVVRIDVSDGIARRDQDQGLRLSTAVYAHILTVLAGETTEIPEQDRMELEGFLSLYFSHHLDKRIPSNAFNALR